MTEDQLAGIGMTEQLARVIRQTPALLADAVAGIHHYLAQYKKAKSEINDGPSVAHGFHVAMDELIEDAVGKSSEISCRKGCAHCCYIEVHTTPDEAALLLRMAEALAIDIDWQRVAHQASADRWRQLDFKARRCVFLGGDNTCQVYEYRPMTCRKYMVANPPEECDSQKYPGGKTKTLIANKAEIMTSALFSACATGTLAKQLMKLRGSAP